MKSLPIIEQPAEKPQDASVPQGRSRGRYAFISLGCPKNTVDSERMLGLLRHNGYELVDDPQGADFAIVNTCGFIDSARSESYAAIREMSQLKETGRLKGLIVAGCLAERQQEAILTECPGVDFAVGVFGRDEITQVADRLGQQTEQRTVFRPAPIRALADTDRLRVTPGHFAYLKISEGCDRLCTFCAIPNMRGKHASKPTEQVVAEARQLAEDGVKELIVVAQDTTYYGIDLYGEPRLPALLRELDQVDGLRWIRLMYLYPMYISDELLDTIAQSERILPYADLPLQHINDTMLRRMARRVTRSETEKLLERMRRRIPGLTLRTTFITGFPGETKEHFNELEAFIRDQEFHRLGVFEYSYEADTPSAKLPEHVPQKTAARRRSRLMSVQQKIAFRHNEQRVGARCDVIVDHAADGQDGLWVGRPASDAPEIDGIAYVTGEALTPGDIVSCEIVGADGYDLIAYALEPAAAGG